MWGNDGGFVEGGEGAGFVNSPSQFTSPDSTKKARRSQNVVPVNIKMINDAPGDALIIGDAEINMITIVGVIRSVDITSTKITYSIDDSTGVIDGVKWMEANLNEEQQRPLMEMTYCRIVGSVRSQANKKNILILKIVPITDLNRVTTHILEVIHSSMKLEHLRGLKAGGGAGTSGAASNATASAGGDHSQVPHLNTSGMGGGANPLGLVGPAKIIYEIIKMAKGEGGISKYDIHEMLKGKVAPSSIDKILEDLSNEGNIFCSIDEDHFKTSDNF